ncbi:hypothetical protein RM529_18005, partial [Zunongwangia sp. F297]
HMHLHIILVKMLERPKTAQLEDNGNGNNLAPGHYRWTFGGVTQKVVLDDPVIFFAKLVQRTKNFGNFRIDYHR